MPQTPTTGTGGWLDPLRLAALLRCLWYGLLLAVALGVAGYGTYWRVRARLVADIYRERLDRLAAEHRQLIDHYNEAVRRTTVTELEVAKGKLSVVVRTAAGEQKRVDTPYDPSAEVYVDFVVWDGRLWIRRVFDARTPPSQGTVIDPAFGQVNWEDRRAKVGKAVYRQLAEGRWAVTVTGDGSLGLAPATADTTPLAPPPAVKDFQEIVREADERAAGIRPLEIARQLLR